MLKPWRRFKDASEQEEMSMFVSNARCLVTCGPTSIFDPEQSGERRWAEVDLVRLSNTWPSIGRLRARIDIHDRRIADALTREGDLRNEKGYRFLRPAA